MKPGTEHVKRQADSSPDPLYIREPCEKCGSPVVSKLCHLGAGMPRIVYICWSPECNYRRLLPSIGELECTTGS